MSTVQIDPGGEEAQKKKAKLREELEQRRKIIPPDLKTPHSGKSKIF